MKNYPKIVLKSSKGESIKNFHHWLFSGAIKKIETELKEGDIIELVSNKGSFIALGHYQTGTIAVRVISFENCEINYDFWKKRINDAIGFRHHLNLQNTNVYRIINGEADYLPGFIADNYNGYIVFQFHSVGMWQLRETFAQIFAEILGSSLKGIFDKSEKTLFGKTKNEVIFGDIPNKIEVLENNNKFYVDVKNGQKTGFFIDQRQNRMLLQSYSANKVVLNLFSYSGGFSIYANSGGAKEIYSVDSSALANDLNKENILLNFNKMDNNNIIEADAFEYLKEMEKDKFDLIILDPPAFAKNHNSLTNALRAYRRINQVAIEKIKSGGIIFTFSCSQIVSKKHFVESIFTASLLSGRKVKILHQLSQAACHPINIYHPEVEYLKGLVLFIE